MTDSMWWRVEKKSVDSWQENSWENWQEIERDDSQASTLTACSRYRKELIVMTDSHQTEEWSDAELM